MNPYPRVIVCPRFESNDSSSLRFAGILAKAFGSRLLLLDVQDKLPRNQETPGAPGALVRRLDSSSAELRGFVEGAKFERYSIRGEPTTGIRDFVLRHDADIVIMSNDAAEGVSSLGTRTRRIVECLPCAVLIVKQPIVESEVLVPPDIRREFTDEEVEEEFPISSWLLEHINKMTEDIPDATIT